MSKFSTLIPAAVATLMLAVGSAHAAAVVHKLPRVVVTGKASAQQPVQLPRVVVTGLSLQSQMQQQLLAAAKNKTAAHRG